MSKESTQKDRAISLPLFITKENKFIVLLLCYLFFLTSYLFFNHIHFFTPRELPFTAVDNFLPFVPETIWIYVSEYLFFVFVYFSIRNFENLNPYFYAMIGTQTASLIIFLFWPTVFPRESFPVPEGLDSLTNYLFVSGRNIDTPASCFPSLHVGLVFLSSLVFFRETRPKFYFYAIWSALIILSTMTTKQHYFVDVVGGMAMATIMHFFFFRAVTYYEPTKPMLCWPTSKSS